MTPQVFNIFDDNAEQNARMLQSLLEAAGDKCPKHIVRMTNAILYAIQSKWASLAIDEAGGWGRRYAGTLMVDPIQEEGGEGAVYADQSSPDYMFVLMVENGVKSWSIKEALLASEKVRRKKTGPDIGRAYIIVPFRWRTPQATTGNKAQATSTFAGVMPKDAHEAALRGEAITPAMAEKLENVNLAGLKRVSDTPHAQYFTFRMVTEDSKGWQYPAIPGVPVFEIVKGMVEDAISKGIANYIEKFAEELKRENE